MKIGKTVRHKGFVIACATRVLLSALLLLSACAVLAPRLSDSQFSRVTAVSGNSLSMGYWAESPHICSVCPCSGLSGCYVYVVIHGEHFQVGAKVELRRGSSVIKPQSVKVFSSRCIGCGFSLKGAAPGLWDVKVTNPDGGTATLTGGFYVIERCMKIEEAATPATPATPATTPKPTTPTTPTTTPTTTPAPTTPTTPTTTPTTTPAPTTPTTPTTTPTTPTNKPATPTQPTTPTTPATPAASTVSEVRAVVPLTRDGKAQRYPDTESCPREEVKGSKLTPREYRR